MMYRVSVVELWNLSDCVSLDVGMFVDIKSSFLQFDELLTREIESISSAFEQKYGIAIPLDLYSVATRHLIVSKLSLFMHDDSENNHGYEQMLDYQMSWVMRVASCDEMMDKQPLLYSRCVSILMKLLEIPQKEGVKVISVNVWKQWARIDVIADVIIEHYGKEEKHVVVIEDKAYTMIHNEQLERYEKIVNDEYQGKGVEKHFWVITFFESYEKKYHDLVSMCENYYPNWRVLSYDMILDDNSPTHNDLFDDFWINSW